MVNKSKIQPLDDFGFKLGSIYLQANQLLWQTIRRLRGKKDNFPRSIKDQKVSYSAMTMRTSFADRNCFSKIFGEENTITAADVFREGC